MTTLTTASDALISSANTIINFVYWKQILLKGEFCLKMALDKPKKKINPLAWRQDLFNLLTISLFQLT